MSACKLPPEAQHLAEVVERRRSARGFKPDPVAPETLDALFKIAQRAPSWCNIQPWRLAVTSPAVTKAISQALLDCAKTSLPSPDVEFPLVYPEPYLTHRRQCGGALYGAMGIAREDKSKRYDAWLRNYELFDAPHLVVVSRDKRLGEYATLDVGVWLGFFMAAAESLGVDCCAMASVAAYPEALREHLEIPAEEIILFGIALGHADPNIEANNARTVRSEVASNVRWIDSLKADPNAN